tara:strand:+ start:1258 stop:1500 length:243 start_codon:yes stop_codon:yes gene_type:complete
MIELLYAAIGFLLARGFYSGRLAWYRHNKNIIEAELIRMTEELDQIEVKVGIREPDWDMDEFMDDGEVWEPYRLKKRNEA